MSNVTALVSYLPADSVEYVIDQWKMSTVEANQLRWTYAHRHDTLDTGVMKAAIVNGTPREWYLELILMVGEEGMYREIREWTMPTFPVTGNDLIGVDGMVPGKRLGDTLKAMKAYWVTQNYEPTLNFFLETMDMFDGSYD